MGLHFVWKAQRFHAVLVSSGRALWMPEVVAKTVSSPRANSTMKLCVFLSKAQ